MLTSSDAKWRCMWHLLIWSIMLTLASQFLDLMDHIPFYIFAAISVLILPVLTAVYSNTAGRRGAGLLRAGYVFCDPVLACITISPVLLLNHLPDVINRYNCLRKYATWNDTCNCMLNRSESTEYDPDFVPSADIDPGKKTWMLEATSKRFLVIQMTIVVPVLLTLFMGRRTCKMSYHTAIFVFAYWLVIAIEATDLVEVVRLGDLYKNVVYTTEAVTCITMIIVNSYAVVTLCSYISPGSDAKQCKKRFDFIYRVFVGASGILLAEIPFVVARVQIMTAVHMEAIQATFYMWFVKDVLFIALIGAMLILQKFGKTLETLPCKINLDNTEVFFQPEKRDTYIVQKQKRVRFQDPPVTTFEKKKQSPNNKVHVPPEKTNDNLVSILQKNDTGCPKVESSSSEATLKNTAGAVAGVASANFLTENIRVPTVSRTPTSMASVPLPNNSYAQYYNKDGGTSKSKTDRTPEDMEVMEILQPSSKRQTCNSTPYHSPAQAEDLSESNSPIGEPVLGAGIAYNHADPCSSSSGNVGGARPKQYRIKLPANSSSEDERSSPWQNSSL